MGRGQLNLMMSLYAVFYAEILKTHKELSPTTKGLRNSPRWQGYSTYLCMDVPVIPDTIRRRRMFCGSWSFPGWKLKT